MSKKRRRKRENKRNQMFQTSNHEKSFDEDIKKYGVDWIEFHARALKHTNKTISFFSHAFRVRPNIRKKAKLENVKHKCDANVQN